MMLPFIGEPRMAPAGRLTPRIPWSTRTTTRDALVEELYRTGT